MNDTKLTVRLPRETLDEAKRYAREHDTSVSRLVITHLEHLRRTDDLLADAPITRRLVGALAPEATIQEYRDYLERKYA